MFHAMPHFVLVPLPGSDCDWGHVNLHIPRTQRVHVSEFEPRRPTGEETAVFRCDPDYEHRHRAVDWSAFEGGGYEFDRLASVGVQELDRPLPPLPRKRSLLRLIFVGICLEEAMQQWAFPTSAQDHSRKEGFL
jgi:hypothetical protein